MSDFNITYKTRNVNSKRLLKDFKATIEEVCDEYISRQVTLLDKTYSYDELTTFLQMYLDELTEKKAITQYNIIADHRLNNVMDVREGTINVLVTFRQTHCLNVTELLMSFAL